jgi:molecular chaperone IbpA
MTSKTLTLRSTDIPSIHKFAIGFDSVFDELFRLDSKQTDNYPPYNITQINEDEFSISLAVAGFGPENLKVTKDKNFLVIEGNPLIPVHEDDVSYKVLHKGISSRYFKREFKLADHVEIVNANLELGILAIYLKREIPEEQKPKTIAIAYNK